MRSRECLAVDATVRSVDADGCVEIEFAETGGCAQCAGTCSWRRGDGPRRVRFRPGLALEPGARVRVSLPARRVVASALLLHGAPLGALLGGGGIGWAVHPSDAATLIGALIGVGAMLVATRGMRRRAERSTLAEAALERLP